MRRFARVFLSRHRCFFESSERRNTFVSSHSSQFAEVTIYTHPTPRLRITFYTLATTSQRLRSIETKVTVRIAPISVTNGLQYQLRFPCARWLVHLPNRMMVLSHNVHQTCGRIPVAFPCVVRVQPSHVCVVTIVVRRRILFRAKMSM